MAKKKVSKQKSGLVMGLSKTKIHTIYDGDGYELKVMSAPAKTKIDK